MTLKKVLLVVSALITRVFGYGGYLAKSNAAPYHSNAYAQNPSTYAGLKSLERTPYFLRDGTPYRDMLTIEASRAVSVPELWEARTFL